MNKEIRSSLKLNVIFIPVVVLMIVVSIQCMSAFEPKYSIAKIESRNGKASIYLKRKVAGFFSSYERRVITTDPKYKFHPDDSTDYIYPGGYPIYYKFRNDTLFVYNSYISPIPPQFDSPICVEQIELSNVEYMELYSDDCYRQKGLEEF